MSSATTAFTPERRLLLEIVGGLVEGIILLDLNRRIAWANDTALDMHGVRSVAELGGTAAGFRKRFTLRFRNRRKLQPRQCPMDRALAGETFNDLVVEVSNRLNPEICRIQQIRSLPLNDSEGSRQGIVLVLLDVTQRYQAEERFERTFHANPAPAVICSLTDMRYVKVNQGFLQMTGHASSDVIGQPLSKVDVLGDAVRSADVRKCLNEGRTIPQMETVIALPDGSNKLVVVAGQPIDMGETLLPCMLFTFIDLESRRQAEDALRHSEERFSKAFRLAPTAMLITTRDGRILDVNDAFAAGTGYSAVDLSHHDDALGALCVTRHAYDAARVKIRKGASVRAHELQLRTRDGESLDCLLSAEPVILDDQRCTLSVLQDITDRKRNEAELMAAIDAVMQDASWFSQTVIEKLAQLRQPLELSRGHAELADLTAREREILGLMCDGLSDPDIAHALGLSRHTVRNHVASLYSKLDVHRRSAAIIWARQRGIVGKVRTAQRRSAG